MLKRNPTILWRELDGEAVLLSPAAGCSYSLNQVGTMIWKLLDGAHTLEEIASAICDEYEVDYDQAAQDVQHILYDFQSNDLLQGSLESSAARSDIEEHSTRTN